MPHLSKQLQDYLNHQLIKELSFRGFKKDNKKYLNKLSSIADDNLTDIIDFLRPDVAEATLAILLASNDSDSVDHSELEHFSGNYFTSKIEKERALKQPAAKKTRYC